MSRRVHRDHGSQRPRTLTWHEHRRCPSYSIEKTINNEIKAKCQIQITFFWFGRPFGEVAGRTSRIPWACGFSMEVLGQTQIEANSMEESEFVWLGNRLTPRSFYFTQGGKKKHSRSWTEEIRPWSNFSAEKLNERNQAGGQLNQRNQTRGQLKTSRWPLVISCESQHAVYNPIDQPFRRWGDSSSDFFLPRHLTEASDLPTDSPRLANTRKPAASALLRKDQEPFGQPSNQKFWFRILNSIRMLRAPSKSRREPLRSTNNVRWFPMEKPSIGTHLKIQG